MPSRRVGSIRCASPWVRHCFSTDKSPRRRKSFAKTWSVIHEIRALFLDSSRYYDPAGNRGRGIVTATIDDETAVCHLDEGHQQDGAKFNRFGLLNIPKHYDQGGEVWLDDISINGQTEQFAIDPGWDARGSAPRGSLLRLQPEQHSDRGLIRDEAKWFIRQLT